jgi:hypothetical protein
MPGTIRKPAAKKTAAKSAELPVFQFEAELNKVTPGTFRMDEVGEKEDHISGSIYLKKTGMDGAKPSRIRVTIEVLEEQSDSE